MINEHTIEIINQEIDNGMRFFSFDRRSLSLVTSRPDNKGSFYDLEIADTIELYIGSHTTLEKVRILLKFYNNLI